MAIARQIFSPTSGASSPMIFVAPAGVKYVTAKVQRSIPTMIVYGNNGQNVMIQRPDGSLLAWGLNSSGFIGDNTTVAKSSPVVVVGIPSGGFKQIFPCHMQGNTALTYAIDQNNQLYAWGGQNSTDFDTGTGITTTVSSPTLVVMPTGKKLARLWNFGGSTAMVSFMKMTDGTVYTWGHTTWCPATPIGLGVSTPTQVVGSYNFTQVFGDGSNEVGWGLLADGTAYSWGNGNFNSGVSGIGTSTAAGSSPIAVLGATKFKSIFNNGQPQPAGTYTSKYFGGTRRNSSGFPVAFWLDTSNQLWGTGQNFDGCLGIGSNPSIVNGVSSPTLVLGGHTYQGIFGVDPTLALGTDGTLYGWGFNGNYQLGQGDTNSRSSPVIIAPGIKFSSQVYLMNDGSVLAFDLNGNLWGWGANTDGLLLQQGGVARSTPTIIIAANTYRQFVFPVTQDSGYALGFDGNIYAWGICVKGSLANGTNSTPQSTPTIIVGPPNQWMRIEETSDLAMFAWDVYGGLWAWGSNGNKGVLGVGDLVSRSSPTIVAGPLAIQQTPITETARTLNVTPGVSYPLIVGLGGAYFNGEQIAGGFQAGYGSIILEWQQ
jgi:alpha-tubulin suppressor-like RCC1 family protein